MKRLLAVVLVATGMGCSFGAWSIARANDTGAAEAAPEATKKDDVLLTDLAAKVDRITKIQLENQDEFIRRMTDLDRRLEKIERQLDRMQMQLDSIERDVR